jgi:hypothetical protein
LVFVVKAFAEKLVVPFEEGAWPSIKCPVCDNGHLTLQASADPATKVEWTQTAATRDWQDWGDPTDIAGTFGAVLRCGNTTDCGDRVHVSGDVGVDYATGYYEDDPWVTYFTVRWFHPALRIVDVPAGTPGSVSSELANVGALVWSNPDAALWSLRKSVEILLDEQGIDKFPPGGTDPRPYSLHKRLKMFGDAHPQYAEIVEMLQATRAVGNEGTHASGRSGKEVLSVVKFVELTLESVYSESDRDAALAHARKINAHDGYISPDS